ncbi:MAG: quinate 5-dehydrogenase [Armatimonadetes bacterium]|nr:quinate 5-dehydrogenase [Armatimonadota bacterium]
MKRIVSVSLGTSQRNKSSEAELLGQKFLIERIGTDGDKAKFKAMLKDLDGKVSAFGVGGCDIYVVAGGKRYAFKEIKNLVSGVKTTPLVDGSGLKNTLERETILRLQREGTIDFSKERVLLMSSVDRYGMAEALHEVCPNVVYGDFLFGLGIPWAVKSYKTVSVLGNILLPIITNLPQDWFYPTGEKQEVRKPKFPKIFDWATIIAGDSLYINRYAPDNLKGKTVITQSVRSKNVEWMRQAGLKQLITTTPDFGGETFATNVMEALLVTFLNKPVDQIAPADYLRIIDQLGWRPGIMDLNPTQALVEDARVPHGVEGS